MTPAPISHHFISQRLRLHYVDWGNPDAPPLVLVHGGRDHCRNWDWVAQPICARDYHVIAPDLRGHGDSAHSPSGDYHLMATYVYDLAQLIHQQKPGPGDASSPIRSAATSPCVTPAYIRNTVSEAGGDRGARDPSPADDAASGNRHQRSASACEPGSTRSVGSSSARLTDRRYATLEEALCADAQAENKHLTPEAQARHLTIHGGQPERGWHLQLEVRQLRPFAFSPVDISHRKSSSRTLERGSHVRHLLVNGARRAGPRTRLTDGRIKRLQANARVVALRPRRPLGPPRPHGGFRARRAGIPRGVRVAHR